MRKGFLASVAVLAASAGVACGQGWPSAPSAAPQGYPAAQAMRAGAPAPVAPAGMEAAGGMMGVPPAMEMPHNGPQAPPGVYDPWAHDTSYDPEAAPMNGSGQLHRAAGGPDRLYLDIEQLCWRVQRGNINFPLATGGAPVGLGVIGNEGTNILIGQRPVDYGNYFNVLRVTGGYWDCERIYGFEMSGFIQEEKSEIANLFAPIGGRSVLARPYIDVFTGQQAALRIGLPGAYSGELHYKSSLKLGGAEANLLRSLVYCDRFKLTLLAGIRYIDHDEQLSVVTRTTVPVNPDPTVPPDLLDTFDEFAVRNQFYGGQLGFQAEFRHGRIFADVTAKCAVGDMNNTLEITGYSNSSIAAVQTHTSGGLLALDSNQGKTNRDDFAYVPELTIKLGYQWTQRISSYIGYNGLYFSRVLRPGEQIDGVVNPTFIPLNPNYGNFFGPVRPVQLFNTNDMWVQGVTAGVSIRY